MRAKIIKTITVIMTMVLIISIMAIEGNGITPYITGFASSIWILLVAIANTEKENPSSRR